MKGFWNDFKKFISKGNIVDLAIAVVIGGAFGKIVTSAVNDIIMPLISLATGGVSVSDWKWVITPADPSAGIAESALSYGHFIQTILDFLIIAFFIFLTIRIIQKSKNKIEEFTDDLKEEIKKRKNKKNKMGESEGALITSNQQEAVRSPDTLKTDLKDQKEVSATIQQAVPEIVTTAKSEDNKNEIIASIIEVSKQSQLTNKAQEALLREIRDLLKENVSDR
jgi:large conductance mechanosensitive channel